MLADPFHADRWDYFFSIRRPGTGVKHRVVIATFKDNALERLVVPDDLPTEAEFVASVVPVRKDGTPPALELTDEQRGKLPPPAPRPVAAAAEPAGPARAYPPLEPR
jgi:outer membrane protein assembly factor BamE